MTENAGWYVKKETGEVYGPVPLDDLKSWAADGRIAPDDFISDTGAQWTPSHQFAPLEMNWFVEVEPGSFYGPAHAMAFINMMREGTLPAAARVRHARTGEQSSLILLEARAGQRVPPAESETGAAATPSAATPERTISWQTMALEKEHYEHDAAKWKALFESERERAVLAEQKLAEAHRTIEQDRLSHHTAAERAAMEIETMARADQLRSQESRETGAFEAVYRELTRGFNTLAEEMAARSEELCSLHEQAEEIRKTAEQRVAAAEAQLKAERAGADANAKRIVVLEQNYAGIVKSLREMNDRFIRLRDQAPAAAAQAAAEQVERIRMTRK